MNSEEQQNFRQNWQYISDKADQILTDYEAVADTVEDAGWGREIAIDHSVLNRTGGEHVEVYADTCLLEAYAFVSDKEENGSLIVDDQGRYVVSRV